MSDQGNALIKTPRQLITVIILAFAVPIVGIILLATYVVRSASSGVGSDAMTEQSIAARMQPVGVIVFGVCFLIVRGPPVFEALQWRTWAGVFYSGFFGTALAGSFSLL